MYFRYFEPTSLQILSFLKVRLLYVFTDRDTERDKGKGWSDYSDCKISQRREFSRVTRLGGGGGGFFSGERIDC